MIDEIPRKISQPSLNKCRESPWPPAQLGLIYSLNFAPQRVSHRDFLATIRRVMRTNWPAMLSPPPSPQWARLDSGADLRTVSGPLGRRLDNPSWSRRSEPRRFASTQKTPQKGALAVRPERVDCGDRGSRLPSPPRTLLTATPESVPSGCRSGRWPVAQTRCVLLPSLSRSPAQQTPTPNRHIG